MRHTESTIKPGKQYVNKMRNFKKLYLKTNSGAE
jgi:hypothetical protein